MCADDNDDGDDDALVGHTLASRYRIEEVLGAGAMGAVYRARHVEVGRVFAVKVLHARFSADPRTRQRFAREAKLAGMLHHTNVVNVVDVGELEDGRRYLVMEYADGLTLLDLINESAPMDGARVVSLVDQLCAGLQHAHELGLIHRDFKPDNVLVERDRHGHETPRIVDFGIAILRDHVAPTHTERLTTGGLILGTPHYMAPEHATGAPIDHRIDLFALGVTCYEMLTGHSPFEGDGVEVARANLTLETPVMKLRVPGLEVDPLLEAFTRKLMMKSRDDRPATAEAARALIALIGSDRRAAAAALGVPFEAPGAAPVIEPAQPQGPVTGPPPVGPPAWPPLVRPPPGGPGPVAPWRRPSLQTTDQVSPARPHIGRLVVPMAAAVAVLVTMAIALRPGRPRGSAPATAAHEALDPTDHVVPGPTPATKTAMPAGEAPAPAAPAASIAGPAPAARAVPAAAPRDTGEPRIVHGAAAITPAGRSPHAPPAEAVAAAPPRPAADSVAPAVQRVAAPPPPSHAPTMPVTVAGVVQLYSSIGRQLKALDAAGRAGATAELWPHYLQIHINDAISDPNKLADTSALLFRIEDQISRRASQ